MSCNVYADTGFENPELWLQKADLVIEMKQTMELRGLTVVQAAKIVGMPSADFREMIKGHFGGVTVDKLVDCLRRLGHDIHVQIKPLPTDPSKHGTLTVLPSALPHSA